MPGRHRLVVVDDEPDLRAMLAEYLGRHDYAVVTAADGSQMDTCLAEACPTC